MVYLVGLFSLSQASLWRSQWPRGLRRRSAAARLMGLWMSVCCDCCVLSGTGFCDELITRPEESYRLWCAVLCDLETSWMRGPWPTAPLPHWGLLRQNTKASLWVRSQLFLSGPYSCLLKIKITLCLLYGLWDSDARERSDWHWMGQRLVQWPSKPQSLSKSYSKYQLTCSGKVHPSPPTRG